MLNYTPYAIELDETPNLDDIRFMKQLDTGDRMFFPSSFYSLFISDIIPAQLEQRRCVC